MIIDNISASELSRKFIKSALLVGKDLVTGSFFDSLLLIRQIGRCYTERGGAKCLIKIHKGKGEEKEEEEEEDLSVQFMDRRGGKRPVGFMFLLSFSHPIMRNLGNCT